MVTIKQIAAEAGVSITTVSNVIQGNTKKVSPETVERIQAILKKRNYIPRFGLRAMSNKQSQMIGVLIHTPSFIEHAVYERPFYGSIIGLLEEILRKQGYYIMVCSSKEVEEIITMVMGWNVDGIISISMPKQAYKEIARKTKKPIVSIDMNEQYERNVRDCYDVTSKDYDAAYQLVEYLFQKGIKKILFMTNTNEGADFRRYRGARDAYKKFYGSKEKLEVVSLEKNYPGRLRIYESYRSLAGQKTAFFFSTDLNASEAINFYASRNIRVPEDLAIVGFDDDAFAKLCPCGLTTMNIHVEEKAGKAIKLLMDLIQGNEITDTNPLVEVTFVERGSV